MGEIDFNVPGVPARTMYSLELYYRYGLETGGFLKAVLINDLFGAMAKGDLENIVHLQQLVVFIYNTLPMRCWGSEKKYYGWMNARRNDPIKPKGGEYVTCCDN